MKNIKRKRIIKSSIILTIIAIIGVICAFCFGFGKDENPSKPSTDEVTYTEMGDKLNYEFVTNGGKYSDIASDAIYARVVGFQTGSTFASGTNWVLTVPDSVSDGSGNVCEVKEIDIPITNDSVVNYPAWAVGYGAQNIKKLVVSENVEYINFGAFNGFDSLEYVEVPFVGEKRGLTTSEVVTSFTNYAEGAKVSFLSLFGDSTFRQMSNYNFKTSSSSSGFDTSGGDGTTIWYDTVTTWTVSMNVPVNLKDVYITDEYLLPTHAFFNNPILENVTVEFNDKALNVNAYKSIGDRVFDSCLGLKSCTLPNQVSSFGEGTFSQCKELVDVTLPTNITTIPVATFNMCYSLPEIIIPNSIRVIGKQAFNECIALSKLNYTLSPTNITTGEFVLPEALEIIGDQAFRSCSSLKKIIVPNNVEQIGWMAFNGCFQLNSISLPFVGKAAGVTSGIESLFGWIFGSYGDVEDTILSSTLCIYQNADNDSTTESDQAYFYVPSSLRTVTIKNDTYFTAGSFMNCSMLESIEILSNAEDGVVDDVTTIEKGAFNGCSSLVTINIPFVGSKDSVEQGQFGWIFGSNAYDGSYGVKQRKIWDKYDEESYYIPNTLTTVTLNHQTRLISHSFYNMNKLVEITVDDSCQILDNAIFTGMSSLERLTMPFVGNQRGNAHDYNPSTWSPTCDAKNTCMWWFSNIKATNHKQQEYYVWPYHAWYPLTLNYIHITDETYFSGTAFDYFTGLTHLKVDDNSGNANVTFARGCMDRLPSLNILEIPFIGQDRNVNSVEDNGRYTLAWLFGTDIDGGYGVSQCGVYSKIPTNLEKVIFGNNISVIGNDAFKGMTSLVTVESNAQIITVGNYAFSGCTNLQFLTLPNARYVEPGDYAFQNCKNLGEIDDFLPSTVTRIGNGSLKGTSITTIDFSRYSKIGNYAFEDCIQLEAIDFTGSTVTSYGAYMFKGCKHLKDVTLIPGSVSAGMFMNCVSLEDLYFDGISTRIPDEFVSGCVNLKAGEEVIDGLSVTYKGFYFDPGSCGITIIGARAFKDCKSLYSMKLPENLITIGNGAFQGCVGLDSLRIPRATTTIPLGTDNRGDNYTTGVFYNCDNDFYLEVFYPESEWFNTWGRNWNCYYKVVIIGDTNAEMFTYDTFDDGRNHKGYIITGLNWEQCDPSYPYAYQNLIFPASKDGLVVYGVADYAFADQDSIDYLANVDNFILGTPYVSLGEGAFNLGDRCVYIYVQNSYSKLDANMHYNDEYYYAENAMVMYQEAFRLVNNTPIFTMDTLVFNLEANSYTYDLGNPIQPYIVSIDTNDTIVKYTSYSEPDSGTNIILNHVYPSGFYNPYDLSMFSITYRNNINVGTATIKFAPRDSRFTGTKEVNFSITRYEIELFFEADYTSYDDDNPFPYGDRAVETWREYYYNGDAIAAQYIEFVTYSGDYWTYSGNNSGYWMQNYDAFGLPTGYKMTGTLRTTGKDSGIYGQYKYNGNDKYHILDNLVTSGGDSYAVKGGFTWQTPYKIYDTNGQEVTRNFECIITKCVQINKFEITEFEWDGTLNDAGIYEYEYTGEAIVPKPIVKHPETKQIMDAKIEVVVTPSDAIYPGDLVYTATISTFDSANFVFADGLANFIKFKVVKAKVYISMSIHQYVIGQYEYFFAFSDFDHWTSYKDLYNLSIKGLGPNSSIVGTLVTRDPSQASDWGWTAGIYKSSDFIDGKSFTWDMAGVKFVSRTLTDSLGQPLDETDYYEAILDLRIEIIYQDFDYDLTLDGNDEDHLFKNDLGVVSYGYDQIIFGADGYEHTVEALVRNADHPDIEFLYDGVTGTRFTFTEKDEYVFTYTISQDRYNTETRSVTLTVINGDYIFDSLDKEYDRNPVDPLSKLLRKPIDYNSDLFTLEYYDVITGLQLSQAPYEIGYYKVVISTTDNHSLWFNDLDSLNIEFKITRRTIYIDVVDTVDPYDEKIYDGEPWKLALTSSSVMKESFNLLPGDTLIGTFLSCSAEVGVYDASIDGNFIANQGWSVQNDALGIQTGYYKIQFRGVYTISPRTIIFDSEDPTGNNYEYEYDGSFHTINVTVSEPTHGYTIYYTDTPITNESQDNSNVEWVTYPLLYQDPGTYTIYFKIVAETYYTVYWAESITILGKDPSYYIPSVVQYAYDGYAHNIAGEIITYDPWNLKVEYAFVDFDYTNFEDLSYSSVCPSFVEVSEELGYTYVVRFSAPNYNTKYEVITMYIVEKYTYPGVVIESNEVDYDGLYHGPFVSIPTTSNLADFDVYYFIGAIETQDTVWRRLDLTETSTANKFTSEMFYEAGVYPVTIKVLCYGYSITRATVDVTIKPVDLELVTMGYYDVFDGNYHTTMLAVDPSSTDSLSVYGDLNNNEILDYKYHTTIGGVATVLDLEVYYSQYNVMGNPNSPYWSTTPLKYKDVGTYMVYIMVKTPNVEEFYGSAEITIFKNPSPTTDLPSYFEIEYLARPILDSEIPVTTIHDGYPVFSYYAQNKSGTWVYTSNPMDLGDYKVTISYKETRNCSPVTVSADFKIIPRKIDIEYDKELEYNGQIRIPTFTVISHTHEVIEIKTTVMHGVTPIEIGDYELAATLLYPNPNYELRLEDEVLEYSIIPRRLYVTLEDEIEFDGVTYWEKTSDWTVLGLLPGDTFLGEAKTAYNYKGLYSTVDSIYYESTGYLATFQSKYDISVDVYSVYFTVLDVVDSTNISVDYYEIVLNINISIVMPPLEVNVEPKTIVNYNGDDHIISYEVVSAGAILTNIQFWEVSNPSVSGPNFSRRQAGTYTIGYLFEAEGFDPCSGEAELQILPADLDIHIDEFSQIYDGKKYTISYRKVSDTLKTGYTILNDGYIVRAEVPTIVYFRASQIDALGYTTADLDQFFSDGMPKSSPIYDIYKYTPQYMQEAGLYYTYVYYPQTGDINLSFASRTLEIKKRALYFDYIGTEITPLIKYLDYTGEYEAFAMADFSFDSTHPNNNLGHTGLATGDEIASLSKEAMATYFFTTSSVNARGEAGNGDPYQADGDFQFLSINILSTNVTGNAQDNYYPVFNQQYGDYVFKVIIKRIRLDVFGVYDNVDSYTGEDILPLIETPSDGELLYYAYHVDSEKNRIDPNLYSDIKDIGYYEVYITILTGTNYLAYDGLDGESVTDPMLPSGYFFKKAYVQVIPREVEVKWTEEEAVYDGELHDARPYIIDVYGNKVDLVYTAYDEYINVLPDYKLRYSGTYYLKASWPVDKTIFGSNYTLLNDELEYHLLQKAYKLTYTTKEPYLYTNWRKEFTIDEIEAIEGNDPWLENHSLSLVVTTRNNVAGVFLNQSQFVTTQEIYDEVNSLNVSSCFFFELDLQVILEDRSIMAYDNDIEREYNAMPVYPDINVTSHVEGSYIIGYCVVQLSDAGELPADFDETAIVWEYTQPSVQDTGKYRIYYNIRIAGDQAASSEYSDYTNITITQAASNLEAYVGTLVYDNTKVSKTDIKLSVNKYNGTASDLVYTFFDASTGLELTDAPSDAGSYYVQITSKADDDPLVHKNYSPLNIICDFKIVPAELSIVIDEDWEVKSTMLAGGWTLTKNFVNNRMGTETTYVNGIVGSHGVNVSVTSLGLERKLYEYVDGDFTQETSYSFLDGLFSINWDVYHLDDSTDLSKNYTVKTIFNLLVHYEYMTVSQVTKTYTYSPYDSRSAADNITVTNPASGYTIKYGTSTASVTDSSYLVSLPGIHVAYFEVSCPEYETYKGSTIIDIKYSARDLNNLLVSDISKVYDSITYDGTSEATGRPTISWITSPGEDLPHPSTWLIEYFKASDNNPSKEWRITGEAMSTVTNAGDYIIRVTIPAGILYSETVIEKYFNISRKVYEIAGVAADMSYNNKVWLYDLPTNAETLSITGMISGHYIYKGVLASSSPAVGTYGAGGNKYVQFDSDGVFIRDAYDNDVSINYEPKLNVSVTIINANMIVETSIPDSGIYTYNGQYHTPTAMVILPSGATPEYSKDGINWSTSPIDFIDVGSYVLHVRVEDVPNYNDFYQSYPFEIGKAQNTISVENMDFEYNGNEVANPIIKTQDYYGYASNANIVTWLDASDNVIPRPKDVGSYKVVLEVPTNDSYEGIQITHEFKITPCQITVTWSSNSLEYNSLPQGPTPTFKSVTYTSWDLNSIFVEGVDYQIAYYNAPYTIGDLALSSMPINVGYYMQALSLIGITDSNFEFKAAATPVVTNYYHITPFAITISYAGSKNYDAGALITIHNSELSYDRTLPTGITMVSDITTLTGALGTRTAKCKYNATSFTNQFKWNPDTGAPVFMIGSSTNDLISNYDVDVNIVITITAGSLPYNVKAYDDVYDGLEHTFTFELTDVDVTDEITIEYSINGGMTWTTTKPMYLNATNTVHILVKVTSKVYGEVILGNDPAAHDYNEFTITIRKADSTILCSESLDKVYDAKMVNIPSILYNGDERDAYLEFKFYKLNVSSVSGATYVEITQAEAIAAGKYYLTVKMLESTNYNASSTLTINFEISQRVILVVAKNQSKIFDGYRWSTIVSNDPLSGGVATISGYAGDVSGNSGLLSGHRFSGILQTASVDAGKYVIYGTDLIWQSSYLITDDKLNDVTSNYKLEVDVDVTITPRDFKVTLIPAGGVYSGKDYFIAVQFDEMPIVSVADLEEIIKYSYVHDLALYQQDPLGSPVTRTIYVWIDAPNYNPYYGSAPITVTPINTDFVVESWPGSAEDIVYNGEQYDITKIVYELSLAPERIPTFTFYDAVTNSLVDGSGIAPTNVGTYYFNAHVDISLDGTASAADTGPYYFTIVKKVVNVEWDSTYKTTDSSGNDVYQVPYTGQPVSIIAYSNVYASTPIPLAHPTTYAKPHIRRANDGSFGVEDTTRLVTLNTKVTTPGVTDAILPGTYTIQAEYASSEDYSDNYELQNDVITFTITGREAGDVDDLADPIKPYPNPTNPLYNITIMPYQKNPLNNFDKNYVYGEQLYVVVQMEDDNYPATDYILEFDYTTGEITTIYDMTFNVIDSNPNFSFTIHFDDTITCPETLLILKLIDDSVYCWNDSGDTDDKEVRLYVDSIALNPDNNEVIIYKDTYLHNYIATGEPITFDITVALTNGTTEDRDDDTILDPTTYTIYWYNNIEPNEDKAEEDRASFNVESDGTYGYSFVIGDLLSTDARDHADIFTISTSKPTTLSINEGQTTARFTKYTTTLSNVPAVGTSAFNSTNSTLTEEMKTSKIAANITTTKYRADNNLMDEYIYISRIRQNTTLADFVTRILTNDFRDIRIYSHSTDYVKTIPNGDTDDTNVTLVFDGKDYATALDVSTAFEKIYIGTGNVIEYVKRETDSSGNEIVDVIDKALVVVRGDLNGDGIFTDSDRARVNLSYRAMAMSDFEYSYSLVFSPFYIASFINLDDFDQDYTDPDQLLSNYTDPAQVLIDKYTDLYNADTGKYYSDNLNKLSNGDVIFKFSSSSGSSIMMYYILSSGLKEPGKYDSYSDYLDYVRTIEEVDFNLAYK